VDRNQTKYDDGRNLQHDDALDATLSRHIAGETAPENEEHGNEAVGAGAGALGCGRGMAVSGGGGGGRWRHRRRRGPSPARRPRVTTRPDQDRALRRCRGAAPWPGATLGAVVGARSGSAGAARRPGQERSRADPDRPSPR
jgi:hypothetical protein